jgi:hypothetical protein
MADSEFLANTSFHPDLDILCCNSEDPQICPLFVDVSATSQSPSRRRHASRGRLDQLPILKVRIMPRPFWASVHRSVAESLDAPPALATLFRKEIGDCTPLLCFQDVNARSPRGCRTTTRSRGFFFSRLFSTGSRTLTRKLLSFRASPA